MHGKFTNMDHAIMQLNEEEEKGGGRREKGGERRERRRRKEAIVFAETKNMRSSQWSNVAVFVCCSFAIIHVRACKLTEKTQSCGCRNAQNAFLLSLLFKIGLVSFTMFSILIHNKFNSCSKLVVALSHCRILRKAPSSTTPGVLPNPWKDRCTSLQTKLIFLQNSITLCFSFSWILMSSKNLKWIT